jgi:hypothetical protein
MSADWWFLICVRCTPRSTIISYDTGSSQFKKMMRMISSQCQTLGQDLASGKQIVTLENIVLSASWEESEEHRPNPYTGSHSRRWLDMPER